MGKLRGLAWIGGKGAASPTGTGRWVASLLPTASLYCEPFAGMLGVLLQRAPAQQEIVNDLDGRVVNWWTVVRDQPDELSCLIALTPKSRAEFERALRDEETDPVRRALDFTIVTQQAVAGKHEVSAWGPRTRGMRNWRAGVDSSVIALAARLENVQLENRDAVDVLTRLAGEAHALIYCDPPYADTVGTAGGYAQDVDRAALADALRAQSGRVAISGYGEEWDHLGWERHERRTMSWNDPGSHNERVEVLWTNFRPASQERLL